MVESSGGQRFMVGAGEQGTAPRSCLHNPPRHGQSRMGDGGATQWIHTHTQREHLSLWHFVAT